MDTSRSFSNKLDTEREARGRIHVGPRWTFDIDVNISDVEILHSKSKLHIGYDIWYDIGYDIGYYICTIFNFHAAMHLQSRFCTTALFMSLLPLIPKAFSSAIPRLAPQRSHAEKSFRTATSRC